MTAEPEAVGGRYTLQEEIGAGPITIVFKGRDEVLARAVVVKILRREIAAVDSMCDAFQSRTVSAAGLSHPHIASVYDTGTERIGGQSCPYIVMEYCEAGTLADDARARALRDPVSVAGIGAAMCDALAFAHDIGVVHGGIKPSNVLLAADGTPKLTDFAIAREAWYSIDESVGTQGFVAPERDLADDATPASDIYSVGAVLYSVGGGRPPAGGEEGTHPLRAIRSGIPRSLSDTIGRALSHDPDRRWSSAAQMGGALRSDQATSTIELVRPPEREPAPAATHADRSWWVPVGIILVFALVAALTLPALIDEDRREAGRNNGGGTFAAGTPLEVAGVDDLDPYGDGAEHSDEAGAAADGDPSTSWTTETYNSSFETLGKPGVGLVFDLGSSVEVSSVELTGETGTGIVLFAADEPGQDERAFDRVGQASDDDGSASIVLDEPVTGRYWLVWITRLPGPDGGRAAISEVRFFGS